MSDRRKPWWNAKAKAHQAQSKAETLQVLGKRKASYKKGRNK